MGGSDWRGALTLFNISYLLIIWGRSLGEAAMFEMTKQGLSQCVDAFIGLLAFHRGLGPSESRVR